MTITISGPSTEEATNDISTANKQRNGRGIYEPDVDTSTIDENKLMRKIDLRLIPWLTLLYFLNFLDRGAIGNAKLYHLGEDLHITDRQYLLALTVFFFPYAVFEPVSNILLKKLRPSRWLSSSMLLWGTVMTLHGVVRNFGGLVGLRLLLGLAEGGMYPGIVFYLSCWYKRSELGIRVAFFFSATTIAGAFSGLLAAAIHNMEGVGGKPGWAWIFILEGLFTVVLSIASFWVIQDFPDTAKFLSKEERVFVIRRLQDDMQFSAAGEEFSSRYVWQSLTDWKTWVAMGIYMGFDGPLYAFSLFTPTIINQLGYKATVANLLSVPIYVWACLMTCVVGFLGNKVGPRGFVNLFLFSIGLVGYIILMVSKTPALSYFAVYLSAAAIYPVIPNSVAWVSSNVEGSYKRSVTLGMAIGFGNINGAVAANIYRANFKPYYRLGHGIVLAYICIGWLSSLIFYLLLKRENRRRDEGERDEVIGGVENKGEKNGSYASADEARSVKGDLWSGFRYTL